MEFSEHQRLFLAAICSHFHTTGEWPTYGILDRKLRSHKGLEVDDIGRDLDGFMYDSMHAWPSGYDPDRTTFLCLSALHTCQLEGICPELANDLDAFMCVIQLCIERYEADEEAKPITAAEVQDRFGVADRPLRNAFRLVGDAGLTSMSNPGTAMAGEQADWSFTVFWTIRKYRHVETLEDLLGVRRQLLTATSSQMASPSRPTVASPRVFPPTRQEPMVAMSSNDRISSESASFPVFRRFFTRRTLTA